MKVSWIIVCFWTIEKLFWRSWSNANGSSSHEVGTSFFWGSLEITHLMEYCGSRLVGGKSEHFLKFHIFDVRFFTYKSTYFFRFGTKIMFYQAPWPQSNHRSLDIRRMTMGFRPACETQISRNHFRFLLLKNPRLNTAFLEKLGWSRKFF